MAPFGARGRRGPGRPGPGFITIVVGVLLLTLVGLVAVAILPSPQDHSKPAGPGPAGNMVQPSATASHLSVAGVSPASIGLSWSQSSDILFSYYTVDRSSNGSNGPWTTVATLSLVNETAYYQPDLTPGATYWWVVVEYDALNASAASNVVEQAQPPVASLSVSSAGSEVNLSWTNSAHYGPEVAFVNYTVLEGTDGGPPRAVANFTHVPQQNATVRGLVPGVSYGFTVRTDDGCSNAVNCTSGSATSNTTSNTVTVLVPSSLSVAVSANRSTVTAGQWDTFTCQAQGGVAPFSYSWTFGSGGSSSLNASTVRHQFLAAGTYNVSCTVRDSAQSVANNSTRVSVKTPAGAPAPPPAPPPTPPGTPVGSSPSPGNPVVHWIEVGLAAVVLVVALGIIGYILLAPSRRRRRPAPPSAVAPAPRPPAPPAHPDPSAHSDASAITLDRPGFVVSEPIPPPSPPPPADADPANARRGGESVDDLMSELDEAARSNSNSRRSERPSA